MKTLRGSASEGNFVDIRCHKCGLINDNLQLSDRAWKCPNCGAAHDRDENGAINIEMEGGRLLAGSGYIG